MTTALTPPPLFPPLMCTKATPTCPPSHLHDMQANLPCHAQPGHSHNNHHPDYIASTLTQLPITTTTSATSNPPPHPLWACQPPHCTCPHMHCRHTQAALLPSN